MHPWQHFDWKQAPSDALKEVMRPSWSYRPFFNRPDRYNLQANVWDTKGKDSADSAWQLGDKMSFKWQNWEDGSHDQDSPTKALKETNVWDNAKVPKNPAAPLHRMFYVLWVLYSMSSTLPLALEQNALLLPHPRNFLLKTQLPHSSISTYQRVHALATHPLRTLPVLSRIFLPTAGPAALTFSARLPAPTALTRGPQLFPVSGYKWTATPASVVRDNNGPDAQPGAETNVLMNYKFPNY
jgi:hypothetical protein